MQVAAGNIYMYIGGERDVISERNQEVRHLARQVNPKIDSGV